MFERNLKERKETMMRTNVGFSHTLSITYYIRLCTLQIKLGIACCKKNLKKFLLNLSKSSLEPFNDTGKKVLEQFLVCRKKGLAVISNDVGVTQTFFGSMLYLLESSCSPFSTKNNWQGTFFVSTIF